MGPQVQILKSVTQLKNQGYSSYTQQISSTPIIFKKNQLYPFFTTKKVDSVAKSLNSVAKTLSHRNRDLIMYVAKILVAKPSATKFLFGCYFATELLSHKHTKFDHQIFGCYFLIDQISNRSLG